MRKFATYCLSLSRGASEAITGHWLHHCGFCINGIVAVHQADLDKSLEKALLSQGLRIFVWDGDSLEMDEESRRALYGAAASMPGGWIFFSTVDQWITLADQAALYSARLDCELDGHTHVRGWKCDRFARGGIVPKISVGKTYHELNQEFPVATDFRKIFDVSLAWQDILCKKDTDRTSYHPLWVRLDCFCWHGQVTQIFEASTIESLKRIADHLLVNKRAVVEDVLTPYWNDIHGWFDFWRLYRDVLEEAKTSGSKKTFVEVGVWLGKSAFYLAMMARALNVNIEIHLVDRFRDATYLSDMPEDVKQLNGGSFLGVVLKNLALFDLVNDCHFIQSDSRTSANLFADHSCYFVFIDAMHTYQDVVADIDAWMPKMEKTGILAGHDYNWPEVARAVHDKLGRDNIKSYGTSWFYRIPLS